MAGHLLGIDIASAEARENVAKAVHNELESLLTKDDKKRARTFFDRNPVKVEDKPAKDEKEEKEEGEDKNDETKKEAETLAQQLNRLKKETVEQVQTGGKVHLTSLDITVYAYLREELVNDGLDKKNGAHLRKSCPNLMQFFVLMENIFSSDVDNEHGIDHKSSEWYAKFKEDNSLNWTTANSNKIKN